MRKAALRPLKDDIPQEQANLAADGAKKPWETILLVEDDENVRRPLGEILKSYGYNVLVAADAAQALEISRQHTGPIHLMVTDILMAGMSGVELAEQLSYDRAGMKVLFATGYPAGVAEGSSLTCEDIPLLNKPFSGRALAAKVREILDEDYGYGIPGAPSTLDAVVPEAISSVQRSLYQADSKVDFTAAESEALRKSGFILEPLNLGVEDPLVQTAAELSALLKDSLSPAAVAEKLGVDPSRVQQSLTSQHPTLYGIRLDSGWVVPEFQFAGSDLVPGFADVLSRLDPEIHPVAFFRWFTTPNPDLLADEETRTLSPRDWLLLGLPAQTVADLAADL